MAQFDLRFTCMLSLSSTSIATPGDDFQPVSGTLTFTPNQTALVFAVPIVNDVLPELNESLYVAITNATLVGESSVGLGSDG